MTEKQKLFCREYLTDLNRIRACRKACSACGRLRSCPVTPKCPQTRPGRNRESQATQRKPYFSASRRSSARKSGCATAISASTRSLTLWSRIRAMPYSVTM